jgi:hypothetical protein
MTSLAFDYERPTTIAEAIQLRAEPGSIVFASGQSLVPFRNLNAVMPKRDVDITRIDELRGIALDDKVLSDVAIAKGRIAAIETHILPSEAQNVIDVRGKIVLPGMIDTHAHVFRYGSGHFGLEPDMAGVERRVTSIRAVPHV